VLPPGRQKQRARAESSLKWAYGSDVSMRMKSATLQMLTFLLAPGTVVSCGGGAAEDAADPTTLAAGERNRAVVPVAMPAAPDPADAALRRSYEASDMALQNCTKLEGDGTIVGQNCPSGSIVFGPYVRIPRDANVRLSFDIQAQTQLGISSDIVSAAGTVFHGGMDEQVLDPKARQHWGYAIRMPQSVDAAEARLWVRGETPASFKISSFKLTVE